MSKLKLKNEDAVVAASLAAAGLKVECLRILEHDSYDDEGTAVVLEKMPTKGAASKFGHMVGRCRFTLSNPR